MRYDERRAKCPRPPEFGEQTDEVLGEFGFRAADEIIDLRPHKVV